MGHRQFETVPKAMTDITLYHNPRCSKSRQTLELLEANQHQAKVVLYLETPPDVATLSAVIKKLGVSVHDIIRTGESEYTKEMSEWSDEKLLEAIASHPILLQRPIVVTNNQARIGRPPESVLEIL